MIKKIFSFFAFTLTFALFALSFGILASENEPQSPEQLIAEVEYLFKTSSETLNYSQVVELSNKIIIQREKYPSDTLAKTYLLLSNVAVNKGEMETALQFVQDGLAVSSRYQKTQLCLQIKLASILSAKKQYQQLLITAQTAINMPQDTDDIKYYLFALSYRSVAYAMLNQHQDALTDLQQIESIIEQNAAFAEHTSLLTILANAYFHLGDFQTALTVQLKILKLRFNLNKLASVDQTYYHLANAYFKLNRFNDAFNAYWEAKSYAEKKSAPIYVAHARQGLGLTLMQQKQFVEAEKEILAAKAIFYQHNLVSSYLETLVSLVQIKNLLNQDIAAVTLLNEAEKLSTTVALSGDYIIIYQLLANMHRNGTNIRKAYFWQRKYSEALLQTNAQYTSNFQASYNESISLNPTKQSIASNQTRQLALRLAEQSELASSFSQKYQLQQTTILILSCIALLLFGAAIFLWLRYRSKKLKSTYEALEKPSYMVASPIQTKQLYQRSFNMARNYAYPLTLGYISIANWQELTFQFNKKIVDEVSREIASLINNHINEFEHVGMINEGEYLLVFPHQNAKSATIKMEKLISALKLQFFANLGTFSVTIAYSVESPNFQDIDPYIFLSQLSGSIKIA